MLALWPRIVQNSSALVQKGFDRLASSYVWSNYPPVDLFHQEVTPPALTSPPGKSPLPPIVICHGLLGNSGNWVGLARVMAEKTGRKVLLPDLRNHGRSPHSPHMTYRHLASDLRQFLVKHDLNEVTLMGHSMGARTAMLLCLTDPERVGEGISIDATPIHATPQHGLQVLQNYFRALKTIDLSKLDYDKLTLSQARNIVDRDLQRFDYLGKVTRQWMMINLGKDEEQRKFKWKINLEVLSDSLKDDLLLVPDRDKWTPYQGDFMFVGGDLSGYIPRDSHSDIRNSGFPNARFAYVPDAGHFVHIDQRDKFLEIILPELKGAGKQLRSFKDYFND